MLHSSSAGTAVELEKTPEEDATLIYSRGLRIRQTRDRDRLWDRAGPASDGTSPLPGHAAVHVYRRVSVGVDGPLHDRRNSARSGDVRRDSRGTSPLRAEFLLS